MVEPSAPEGTTTEKILKFLTDFLDTEVCIHIATVMQYT